MATESYSYVLDGSPTTAEALERLSAGGTHLIYVAPVAENPQTMQVFSGDAGFAVFKQEHDRKVNAQGLYVSLRTKTTFYDGENYTGASLVANKDTKINDLNTLSHGSVSWNNDISSVKGADCVYTYLWSGTNLTGGVVAIPPGSNLDKMPSGFNDKPGFSTISSVEVKK